MFPTSTAFDIADRGFAYVVLSRDFDISARIIPDRNRLLFRQFVHTVIIAFILAVLRNLVVHVDRLVTKKQMIRIYANRIIAGMQNMLVTGDLSAEDSPCDTMCALLNDSEFTRGKTSVSTTEFENWSCPNPTRRSLLDVIFKGG